MSFEFSGMSCMQWDQSEMFVANMACTETNPHLCPTCFSFGWMPFHPPLWFRGAEQGTHRWGLFWIDNCSMGSEIMVAVLFLSLLSTFLSKIGGVRYTRPRKVGLVM